MAFKQFLTYFLLIIVLPLSVLGGIAWVYRGNGAEAVAQNKIENKTPAQPRRKTATEKDSQLSSRKPAAPTAKSNSPNTLKSDRVDDSKPAQPAQPSKSDSQSSETSSSSTSPRNTSRPTNDTQKISTRTHPSDHPGPTDEPTKTHSADSNSHEELKKHFAKKILEVYKSDFTRVVFPDTIEIEVGGKKIQFRLESVTTPRRGQPYHDEGIEFVKQTLGNSPVTVYKTFQTQRSNFGYVIVDNKNLGDEVLKNGLGWVYPTARKTKHLIGLETQAKAARKGLWMDEAPEPPWEYVKRQNQRK